MISRRRLLTVAGAVPAATVMGATEAEARPIVLDDRTARTYGPVMMIGDSTTGGYVGGLRQGLVAKHVGPFRCDIQGSRSISRASKKFPSGIAAVRSARANGFEPKAWVLALGSNDMWFIGRDKAVAGQMIEQILKEIGASRFVSFLTIYSTKKGNSYPRFNEALNAATDHWPRLTVVDWASLARQHPKWHGPDGVHYNNAGAIARNGFLVDAMIAAVKTASAPQAGRRSSSARTGTSR